MDTNYPKIPPAEKPFQLTIHDNNRMYILQTPTVEEFLGAYLTRGPGNMAIHMTRFGTPKTRMRITEIIIDAADKLFEAGYTHPKNDISPWINEEEDNDKP